MTHKHESLFPATCWDWLIDKNRSQVLHDLLLPDVTYHRIWWYDDKQHKYSAAQNGIFPDATH